MRFLPAPKGVKGVIRRYCLHVNRVSVHMRAYAFHVEKGQVMQGGQILVCGDVHGLNLLLLELTAAPQGVDFGEGQLAHIDIKRILIVVGKGIQRLLPRLERAQILFYLLAVVRPADRYPRRELLAPVSAQPYHRAVTVWQLHSTTTFKTNPSAVHRGILFYFGKAFKKNY